jgi:ubiquinone/menaquinone biosynthesis C-methylase UbiE
MTDKLNPQVDLHRLRETQLAFDSVAREYDGPSGNNTLVQRMRGRLMLTIKQNIPRGQYLLDLGCGTGLDAEHLAQAGYKITAVDWSPKMVQRTRARIEEAGLPDKVETRNLGFHQLEDFKSELFDGVYSDLGALNCATSLDEVAESLFRILKPNGKIIASVIGQFCPWEWMLFVSKGQWKRAHLRFSSDMVSVPLNGQTVWTRYFMPREFDNIFVRAGFRLISQRALSLFVPPPYMVGFAEHHSKMIHFLQQLDDLTGNWPILRNWGDHFLVVLAKNG